ncbi:pilus assembly protein CpaF [Brevibacillus aydinogluensis]|jgi:pilus assembly protein CpaF|uniref:CpaF family protein n=1 Tax=Brevibacillus aydinogluensis TaxID=927786 RepID=UPI0028936382|nr:ATPase, T2SS/T4P/T4SS family [Brevibacillus aydinogluensis]MDT3417166.1 pilus assembly protein CpaF [Brevibacillus aydinogluensis]
MTKTMQPRNRVNLQQLQSQMPRVAESTQDDPMDVEQPESKQTLSRYEMVRNEIRTYLLTHHPRLLQEALITPMKKKPEFDRVVRTYIQLQRKMVPNMTVDEIVQRAWKDLCSLGPLDDVLKSDEFTEIMLNGFDQPWVQQNGRDVPASEIISFDSSEQLSTVVITKILNSCGKAISEARPIVDARIGDARVNIVASPISQMRGPIVSIRKFPPINLTPEGFLGYGTASEEMLEFIELAVVGECTIVMGGATGSGKTTTYKMMAGFIPKGQRTIVIEDTAEMRLEVLYPYEQGYHFLSEECRIMGDPELDVTIQHLLEAGMRQKPHRFIIGEIRRGVDLLSAVEAANTGHATWWTMHGRSAKHLFKRMTMRLTQADPSMTQQNAVELLTDSVDIIMMQKLFKEDKKRRVFEIVEVAGVDEDTGKPILNPIFEYDWEKKNFFRRNPISTKLIEIFRNAEIPFHRYEKFTERVD